MLCRYGETLDGLCELIPLDRKGSRENVLTIVLLLFSDKLAVAAASEEEQQLTQVERIFPVIMPSNAWGSSS